MPLSVQGLLVTVGVVVFIVSWFLLITIADDFIDRFKQFRKTQKKALAAATTNAQRK